MGCGSSSKNVPEKPEKNAYQQNEAEEVDFDSPCFCICKNASRYFYVGQEDGVRVYDLEGKQLEPNVLKENADVISISSGGNGAEEWVSGDRSGNVKYWNGVTCVHEWKKFHEISVSSLQICPIDHKILVSGSRDNWVKVLDLEKLVCIEQDLISRNLVTDLDWMDEHTFLQGSEDKRIRRWDRRAGLTVVQTFFDVSGMIVSSCCSHPTDLNLFLSTQRGNSNTGCGISLWDIRKEKNPIKEFKGHSMAIPRATWINNDFFISVSHDKTVKVWNKEQSADPHASSLIASPPNSIAVYNKKVFVPTMEGVKHFELSNDFLSISEQ